MAFVITNKFWVCHDTVPVILDVNLSDLCLFEMVEDLDNGRCTNLMILMPTFLKTMILNAGASLLMSYSACSELKRF